MAGTLARYQLGSTTEHLIAPLHKAGWKVDYFYSLYDGKLGANNTWRGWAENFEPDPLLSHVQRQDLDATISQRLKMFGADVGKSKVYNHTDPSLDDLSFIHGNNYGLWNWSARGAIARRNFVLMHKEINILWRQVETREKKIGAGFQYSYVMFLRDDAYWLKDFDLDLMLQIGNRTGRGQIFTMGGCNRASAKFDVRRGLVDFIFLVDRTAANIFGNIYKYIARPGDMGKSWLQHLNRTNFSDSEIFYRQLATFTGTEIIKVPVGLIPLQRVGRLHGHLCRYVACSPYLHTDLPNC